MAGYKPKLIEVALPLAAINAEAAREKSIRHGHPSTLHLWWARRPLAAARAVIWASLVDDPSGDESLTAEEKDAKREDLFKILEKLVKWENTNDPDVLAAARAEIDRCFPEGPPPILDPFAGGGAIPLEAQRLGLTALAGDLNPVAVLINKAMIEIPPRFAGRPPVHPEVDTTLMTWDRAQSLATDVEAYGRWMRNEAERRIGHLYPDATGPDGEKLTPIAWIWARTVESPDPAWSGHVPLVASWVLANRSGKLKTWIEPIIDRDAQTITYEIRKGGEPTHERTVSRSNGTCIATGAAIPGRLVDSEARAGRLGAVPMAVVLADKSSRSYVAIDSRQFDVLRGLERERASIAQESLPSGKTRGTFGGNAQGRYFGFFEFADYFSDRQLVALTTFSGLLSEAWQRVRGDALAAGMPDDDKRLRDGGSGATAYADAIATYLAFAVDKCADYWSTICTWNTPGEKMRNTFGRQAIPMTWDFAECNPFSSSTGNWMAMINWVRKALDHLPASIPGDAVQRDARARVRECAVAAISTDPPYYDNISYADLSDFFFVWLRRNLSDVWPDECATLLTPKADELIANPYRAGSRKQAEVHFESGMAEFMTEVAQNRSNDVPATIFYAYKATETKEGEVRATGWDTFLQAVLDAGLQVNATWPMRTEKPGRMVAIGTNALASSIVLACRPRPVSAALATRGEFVASLRAELPEAVRILQSRQHRSRRHGSVHNRARHKGILPIRQGHRGRWVGDVGLVSVDDHQRRARRDSRRGGGRTRRTNAICPDLVLRARIQPRELWRCRQLSAGEEYVAGGDRGVRRRCGSCGRVSSVRALGTLRGVVADGRYATDGVGGNAVPGARVGAIPIGRGGAAAASRRLRRSGSATRLSAVPEGERQRLGC